MILYNTPTPPPHPHKHTLSVCRRVQDLRKEIKTKSRFRLVWNWNSRFKPEMTERWSKTGTKTRREQCFHLPPSPLRSPSPPAAVKQLGVRRAECGSVQCWLVGERRPPVRLPLSWLTARQGDVTQVEDRKWVGLRVEDPVFKRHQVIAGEQQVQIPEGGGRREREDQTPWYHIITLKSHQTLFIKHCSYKKKNATVFTIPKH